MLCADGCLTIMAAMFTCMYADMEPGDIRLQHDVVIYCPTCSVAGYKQIDHMQPSTAN